MTLDDVHERALAIGYTAADAELLEASLHYYIHPDIGVINKETGVTQLLQLAELHKPKLVIVDTLSRVIEADESASQPYHDAYRLAWSPLKRMGITAVRLDHTGSGGPWVPDKVDLVKHPEAPIHRLKGASTQPAPDVAEWVDIRIDRGRFPGSGRLGLLKNAREKAKADLTVACIVHCQRVIDTAIERQDGHVDRLVNKRLPTNRIEWSKQSLAELGGLVPLLTTFGASSTATTAGTGVARWVAGRGLTQPLPDQVAPGQVAPLELTPLHVAPLQVAPDQVAPAGAMMPLAGPAARAGCGPEHRTARWSRRHRRGSQVGV